MVVKRFSAESDPGQTFKQTVFSKLMHPCVMLEFNNELSGVSGG